MDYTGLMEFLTELQSGKILSNWELERVEQLGADDDGEMRFAVILSVGIVQVRVTSYIPPKALLRHVFNEIETNTRHR